MPSRRDARRGGTRQSARRQPQTRQGFARALRCAYKCLIVAIFLGSVSSLVVPLLHAQGDSPEEAATLLEDKSKLLADEIVEHKHMADDDVNH